MMSRTVVMPLSKPSRRRLGREALRAWYAPRREAYPWRGSHDPYAVLVSEVMLQQTQAARVVPAYASFLRRFPTVRALPSLHDATSSRNGVALATTDAPSGSRKPPERSSGTTEAGSHRTRMSCSNSPGVGPYTSAAVASLGFGEPVAVVDTNVRGVVSRVHLGMDRSRGAGAGRWARSRTRGSIATTPSRGTRR